MTHDVPAFAHESTRRALRRSRYRAGGMAAAGIFVVGVTADLAERGRVDPDGMVGAVGALALIPLFGGLLGLVKTVRVARVLKRYPWTLEDVRTGSADLFGPNGQPVLLLGPRLEQVMTMNVFVWRWNAVEGHDRLWFAGDQNSVGVVSPPDSDLLLLAHRPRFEWWRRRLRDHMLPR